PRAPADAGQETCVMESSSIRSNAHAAGEASAITKDGGGPREAGESAVSRLLVAGNDTDAERGLYTLHPLFPREAGAREARDIAYLILFRRRPDGQVELCPQRFEAKDIPSWADVVRRWGG